MSSTASRSSRSTRPARAWPATTSVVTPLAVPQSPTDLAVELGNGAITVSWVAPVDTGGTALTGFTVTADPGGASCTAAAGDTSCVVTGLTKGSTYTFEVVAENSVGAQHRRRRSTRRSRRGRMHL